MSTENVTPIVNDENKAAKVDSRELIRNIGKRFAIQIAVSTVAVAAVTFIANKMENDKTED